MKGPTHASAETTRWGVVVAIGVGLFDLYVQIMSQGHDAVTRQQLDRMWDNSKSENRTTLETARHEIALSCACCLNNRKP